MKMLLAMIISQALVAGVAATPPGNVITQSIQQEFRDFHGENGKTVRGRIAAYNPDSDIVTIAKENKRTHKVGLSFFSKADQTHVREWHLIQEFFTQNHFYLSAKRKQIGGGMELMIWRQEEIIDFDIILENRSHYDLNGLTLGYRIYYEQKLNYRGQVMSQGMKSGTRNIGILARGEKVQFEIQAEGLPKEGQFEYYKDNKMPSEKILGIWIRIYLPLADGNQAMREFSTPNTLINNRKWITPEDPNHRQEN